jgi:hypothetical protein
VRSASDLLLPDGVAVIANIPFILNKSDRRRRAFVFTSFVAAYSFAMALLAIVIISARHH